MNNCFIKSCLQQFYLHETAATSCFCAYPSCQFCYEANAPNSIAKASNSIVKVMKLSASTTNSSAKPTNSTANRTNTTAKVTNSIAKTCNNKVPPKKGLLLISSSWSTVRLVLHNRPLQIDDRTNHNEFA